MSGAPAVDRVVCAVCKGRSSVATVTCFPADLEEDFYIAACAECTDEPYRQPIRETHG